MLQTVQLERDGGSFSVARRAGDAYPSRETATLRSWRHAPPFITSLSYDSRFVVTDQLCLPFLLQLTQSWHINNYFRAGLCSLSVAIRR
jgi:hypothetical protein